MPWGFLSGALSGLADVAQNERAERRKQEDAEYERRASYLRHIMTMVEEGKAAPEHYAQAFKDLQTIGDAQRTSGKSAGGLAGFFGSSAPLALPFYESIISGKLPLTADQLHAPGSPLNPDGLSNHPDAPMGKQRPIDFGGGVNQFIPSMGQGPQLMAPPLAGGKEDVQRPPEHLGATTFSVNPTPATPPLNATLGAPKPLVPISFVGANAGVPPPPAPSGPAPLFYSPDQIADREGAAKARSAVMSEDAIFQHDYNQALRIGGPEYADQFAKSYLDFKVARTPRPEAMSGSTSVLSPDRTASFRAAFDPQRKVMVFQQPATFNGQVFEAGTPVPPGWSTYNPLMAPINLGTDDQGNTSVISRAEASRGSGVQTFNGTGKSRTPPQGTISWIPNEDGTSSPFRITGTTAVPVTTADGNAPKKATDVAAQKAITDAQVLLRAATAAAQKDLAADTILSLSTDQKKKDAFVAERTDKFLQENGGGATPAQIRALATARLAAKATKPEKAPDATQTPVDANTATTLSNWFSTNPEGQAAFKELGLAPEQLSKFILGLMAKPENKSTLAYYLGLAGKK